MKYVHAPAGVFLTQVSETEDIVWDGTHYTRPGKLTPEESEAFGVYPLTLVTPPAFDRLTQGLLELDPVMVGGVWTQQWGVNALSTEAAAANLAAAEIARITTLWQAAHDLEYAAISGSAIGLITLGVIQAKPKCLAVQGWIKTIWTEYYTRKANGSVSTDFSLIEVCPYSVPELMVELGM